MSHIAARARSDGWGGSSLTGPQNDEFGTYFRMQHQHICSRRFVNLRSDRFRFPAQRRFSLQDVPKRRLGSLHSAAAVVRETHIGGLSAADLRFAIIVSRFNDLVTKLLLEGTIEGLHRHGAPEGSAEVIWVPGSFELPVVAKSLAKSGKFDAVIAVGTVVRGATTHYEAVVSGATSGLLGASTDSGVPVIFTVLTTETMEQALDRAGGKVGNKGYEGAVTAIEMANLMKSLRAQGLAVGPW